MPTTVLSSTFDTTADGWTGTGATVARSTTTPADGAGCLLVTATAAGDPEARSLVTAGVTGGDALTVTLKYRPEVTKRSVYLYLNYYTATDGYVATSDGANSLFVDQSAMTLNAYGTRTWTATIPTGLNIAKFQLLATLQAVAVNDAARIDTVTVVKPDAAPATGPHVRVAGVYVQAADPVSRVGGVYV